MKTLDITGIASELGVSSKTVTRLIKKYEDRKGDKVGHTSDKADARRKIYKLEDINQVLEFCGYPTISYPEPVQASEQPDVPVEISTDRGWMTVSEEGSVIAPRTFDSERNLAKANRAAKIEVQGLQNLDTYLNQSLGNYVQYRMSGLVSGIDAAFANAARNTTFNADSVLKEEDN